MGKREKYVFFPKTISAYLDVSFQLVSNHDAHARLDVEQLAGLQEDVLVGLLPRQVAGHQQAVEVLAEPQPFNLLPLGPRRPVRDQTE